MTDTPLTIRLEIELTEPEFVHIVRLLLIAAEDDLMTQEAINQRAAYRKLRIEMTHSWARAVPREAKP